MSNIAHEMLPGGGFIVCRAEECSEADRAKIFHCVYCGVRVYLHLPAAGRGISPYFSADLEPHKKGCPNYREDLFQTVAHLDHTGSGVDLSELMKGFRQVDRRPRPEGGKGKEGGPKLKTKDDSEEEDDRPIRREVRVPKTVTQLYGILKDPAVTEYAGHDVQELIVDKSTINYHRNHTLDHPAMVVCKRCIPPEEIVSKLLDEDINARSLTFRAPYAAPRGQQSIYYILVHDSAEERKKTLLRMKADREKGGENKPDDKYLAMAAWSPYIETNWIRAYIGHLPSAGCFHRLPHKYDCDEE